VHLALLGTAGWMPQDSRETAALLVRDDDRALLFDAGTGVRRLITNPELIDGATSIDVLLSHFHLDHIIGLSYLFGLPSHLRIAIWGPGAWCYHRPTAHILQKVIGEPYLAATLDDRARIYDLAADGTAINGFAVHAQRQIRHTAPSIAFRLDDVFAYCTDTEYDPTNAAFAAGSKLLIHEAWTTGSHGGDGHSSAVEAARVAYDADVEHLLLVHIAPTADTAELSEEARVVFPPVAVATDLMPLSVA
jgi:ribonuclease BN (tRNA processing enzyme)